MNPGFAHQARQLYLLILWNESQSISELGAGPLKIPSSHWLSWYGGSRRTGRGCSFDFSLLWTELWFPLKSEAFCSWEYIYKGLQGSSTSLWPPCCHRDTFLNKGGVSWCSGVKVELARAALRWLPAAAVVFRSHLTLAIGLHSVVCGHRCHLDAYGLLL